jgi:ABC-type sugar transport system ATPase subunit
MQLVLDNLRVRAGTFALGPLTLAVNRGEYLAVLGPTGAGKTVTLETIAGLRMPEHGHILMDGRDINGMPAETRRIGFLYQDGLLFPHLNVRRNLAYGTYRMTRDARTSELERLARLLHIEALLERMPAGLSGGERQRVALGRALAASPVLLLLDEPMAALDPNTRHALRNNLLELHRELRTTTIHVTHNFSEAIALGDRVAIMIDGKILQVGPPQEVFGQPNSTVVAHFLKSATIAAGYEPPDPDREALTICPDAFTFAVAQPLPGAPPRLEAALARIARGGPGDGEEAVAGRVVAVEAQGAGMVAVTVRLGIDLRVKMAADPTGADALVAGQSVWVRLPRQNGQDGQDR